MTETTEKTARDAWLEMAGRNRIKISVTHDEEARKFRKILDRHNFNYTKDGQQFKIIKQ